MCSLLFHGSAAEFVCYCKDYYFSVPSFTMNAGPRGLPQNRQIVNRIKREGMEGWGLGGGRMSVVD